MPVYLYVDYIGLSVYLTIDKNTKYVYIFIDFWIKKVYECRDKLFSAPQGIESGASKKQSLDVEPSRDHRIMYPMLSSSSFFDEKQGGRIRCSLLEQFQ